MFWGLSGGGEVEAADEEGDGFVDHLARVEPVGAECVGGL